MTLDFQDYHDLREDSTVLKKIRVGILGAVRTILDSNLATEGAERWQFARDAMRAPQDFEDQIIHFVIEENKTVTDIPTFVAAAQSSYDTNVANAVDKLYPVGI